MADALLIWLLRSFTGSW